jgi:hypothetical protein
MTRRGLSLWMFGIALWLLYGGGGVSNDGIWYLVRGQEFLGLTAVDPGLVTLTSTPHPITTLAAAAALIANHSGAATMLLLAAYALCAATLMLVVRIVTQSTPQRFAGSALVAAMCAAAIFATRPITAVVVSNASLDVAVACGLVAFTLAALQGQTFSLGAGATLLAVGLLKPETWPIAACLALYRLSTDPRRSGWILMASAAPLIWISFDWIVSGNPLASLDTTAAVERDIRARTAVAQDTLLENLVAAPLELARGMGAGYIVASLLVAAVAWPKTTRAERIKLAVIAAVAAAFLLGLTVEALAGKRMVTRYALPALALSCVFTGVLLQALLRSPGRTNFRAIAIVVFVVVISIGPQASMLKDTRDEAVDRRTRLVASQAAFAAVHCRRLAVPTSLAAPYAMYARPGLKVVVAGTPIGQGLSPDTAAVTANRHAGRDIIWSAAQQYFPLGPRDVPSVYARSGWSVRERCQPNDR